MSLKFSRKTDYALVALAALAGERESEGASMMSAREVADRHHLPLRLLMNLLKRLAAAELVISQRGAGGGYRLARSPRRITVAEVLEAIEGPPRLTPCCEPETSEACTACQLTSHCPIEEAVRELNAALFDLLRRTTLDDLIQYPPRPAAAIPRPAREPVPADFKEDA